MENFGRKFEEKEILHPGVSFGEFLLSNLRTNAASSSVPAEIDSETGKKKTFKELLVSSIEAARGLRKVGLKRGDTLWFFSRNKPDVFPVLVGAMCEGVTCAFVTPPSTKAETQHFFSLVPPKAILSEAGFNSSVAGEVAGVSGDVLHLIVGESAPFPGALPVRELCRLGREAGASVDTYQPVHIASADLRTHVAFVLFSSGSTGLPKAVALSNYGYLMSCFYFGARWGTYTKGERVMITSHLSWVSGSLMTLGCMMAGTTRIVANFTTEKDMIDLMERFKANIWFIAAPHLLRTADLFATLKPRPNLSALRLIITSGVALSAPSQEDVMATLGVPVVQGYGITETGALVTKDLLPPRPGSSGTLLPGMELRFVDVETGKDVEPGAKGELRVKSPSLMTHYIGNPEATEKAFDEQGFYCTGDLGYTDADGYCFIVDRVKELIKYNGREMAPAEIEAVLLTHPSVSEACVVGQPNRETGEVPTAFVSLRSGANVTEQELDQLVADRLSDHKRLRGGIYFEEELLKTPNGKIERKEYKKKALTHSKGQSLPM